MESFERAFIEQSNSNIQDVYQGYKKILAQSYTDIILEDNRDKQYILPQNDNIYLGFDFMGTSPNLFAKFGDTLKDTITKARFAPKYTKYQLSENNIYEYQFILSDVSSVLSTRFEFFLAKCITNNIQRFNQYELLEDKVFTYIATSGSYKNILFASKSFLIECFALPIEEKYEQYKLPEDIIYFKKICLSYSSTAKTIVDPLVVHLSELDKMAYAESYYYRRNELFENSIIYKGKVEANATLAGKILVATAEAKSDSTGVIPTPTPETPVAKKRLNSNIYRNIFSYEVFDLQFIENLIDNTTLTIREIVSENHEFQVNDVVAYDYVKGYFKPLAASNFEGKIEGIVTHVRNKDVFTLTKEGRIPYPHLSFDDTTILYLSDKESGKMVHCNEIDNMTYMPIAIYTTDSIIINILNGAYNAPINPYEDETTLENFEKYTALELQQTVNAVMGE